MYVCVCVLIEYGKIGSTFNKMVIVIGNGIDDTSSCPRQSLLRFPHPNARGNWHTYLKAPPAIAKLLG